jgi:hypothetical protein
MERRTVEYTFEGEKLSSVTDEHATTTLYRTPEDTYFVHIDARHIGDHAVLEVGCFPRGLPEDIIKAWFPKLLATQSGQ